MLVEHQHLVNAYKVDMHTGQYPARLGDVVPLLVFYLGQARSRRVDKEG